MEDEVIQMVDDDEIENVGIMSGFMDDLEELMSEIDAEEMGGEDADMAAMMGRTPDSPEILMNNLRGDMRSIDARREELADLVGAREAEETPEGVLALLQPVLAQQQAAPPMPMPMPMPPQGMPPEMMGMPPQGMPPMPPEMMGGMPPPMPQAPMGIESISVDETIVPGMYRGGPVQNFNQGSGAMGVTPANDAFSAYPSDVVQEAQRRVRYMVDGGMVQNYNRGGVVQYYDKGSTPEAVSPAGRYPAATVQGANAYIEQLLAQKPSAGDIDLESTMADEAELYRTLGLGTDPQDARTQMLLDIGQAAFQYGSNVGPDGRPMQGSGAARLSQSLAPLAGKVGARAGQMSKEGQALKMLALKGAQGKIATAQAADVALAARQADLAIDIAQQDPGSRMLSDEEVTIMKLDSEAGSWGIDGEGKPFLAGGRTPAPLVNMGNAKLGQTLGNLAGAQLDTSYNSANGAMSTLNSIALIKPTLKEEDGVFAGPLSGAKVYANRLATSLGVEGATDQERLNNTVNAMRTLAQFELQAAEAMRGQGQITENERVLIRRTAAGDLTAMTQGEIIMLLGALEKTAQYKVSQHNARLAHFKTVYEDDPDTIKNLELFELGDVPIFNASPATGNRAAAQKIIDGGR